MEWKAILFAVVITLLLLVGQWLVTNFPEGDSTSEEMDSDSVGDDHAAGSND